MASEGWTPKVPTTDEEKAFVREITKGDVIWPDDWPAFRAFVERPKQLKLNDRSTVSSEPART